MTTDALQINQDIRYRSFRLDEELAGLNRQYEDRIITATELTRRINEAKLVFRKHQEGDLRFFLIPFLLFKAHLVFKNERGAKEATRSLWGHEHRCTYSQCYYGRVEDIYLNRKKGYEDLVRHIESKKRSLRSAKIYMRTEEGGPTEIECRSWYNGEWETIQDPDIPDAILEKTLYFKIENNQLILLQENPYPVDIRVE